MPSRDPKTGKEIGGAEKNRKKFATQKSRDKCKWAREFEEAGKPNLDDPGTDLDYVRKLQLIVLRQMATTPKPSLLQQECWKRIREMSAVLGMTSNRAQLESKVKKLKTLLRREAKAGAVSIAAGAGFPRSPNARGAPRGPRVLPDTATADDLLSPAPEDPPTT